MSKISIITTTYKHEDYVTQTIESVLSQKFTDWELLIWDDSPDNKTWDIIQVYTAKYPDKIKSWHHKENKWIVDNLNFLLDKVSIESEYIAFLEWDDLFTSDNLEEKIKIFNTNPEVGLVYNNLDFINSDWDIFYKNFLKKAPFYLKNQKLSKIDFIKNETFYWSYSTLMIKKEILEKEKILNPTTDKLYTVSDWDLFFRIATKYNCYWIEKSLTLYRRHEWNISSQYMKLFNDLEIQINEYLKTWFIDKKLFKIKLSFINLLRSVAYLEKIDRKNSIKHLLKSIRLSPFTNIIYKKWIFIINLLPKYFIKLILKKIIKRW